MPSAGFGLTTILGKEEAKMLTWAIVWMIVKTKMHVTGNLDAVLFITAILDMAIVYMVVDLVAKAIS